MASHLGSFAGGFAAGFLNAYNARVRAEYTRAIAQHYRYVMLAAGYNPDTSKFWDTDGTHGGGWNSPYQQPMPGTDQYWRNRIMGGGKNVGVMPPVDGGGGGGGGARSMNFENANKVASYLIGQGVPPVVATGFVGSMAHESGGFQNDAYNPDDNGSPSGGWGQWHKDRFADFTSRFGSDRSKWTSDDNMAMFKHEMEDTEVGKKTLTALKNGTTLEDGLNTSIDVYEGASRNPNTLNWNSRLNFAQQYANRPQQAAASSEATTGPKAGQMSPAGGPYISRNGQLYETDADGKIKPTPVADKPAAAATPQAAEIASPGGQFAVPGGGQAKQVPSPDDLISLSSPQSDPNKGQQGLQTGNARNPLARDPYWRPNPVMPPPKKAEQPQKSPVATPLPPPRPVAGAPAQPMMPPRTSTPDSAGPEYVPGTPPRPPHTPTPATAYPQPVQAAPAPSPTVASAMAKEPMPQLPPEEPPQAADAGGGGASMPTVEPLPQQIPFVDPWVDFQQQNPYQPIVFQSRRGGPIGYDDGGDVTIDSSGQGDKSKPGKFSPIPIPTFNWTPVKDESPTNIGMIGSRKGGPIGYANGGDVDPGDEGPEGMPGIPNPMYPMALTGLASSAVRNAPAAYRAFTDPDSPTAPTAQNMGNEARTVGTALAMPVITQQLLRQLYAPGSQQQLPQRAPSPVAQPQQAPQPMNTAKQFPSPNEYADHTPTYTSSPMGMVGGAIQPYSPAIGNAIVSAGNWVDAHLPFADQLKQRLDDTSNANDEMREQRGNWERQYHPEAEDWRHEQEQRELETPEREVQWQRTYMLPMKRAQAKHARGGPVMGYAKGGTIVKLQGGGNPSSFGSQSNNMGSSAGNPSYTSNYTPVPYASYQDPATATPSMGMFNASTYADPGYQLWRGGEQWLGSQPTSPYNAQAAEMTPGGVQADINALPANLQAWYKQENADAMSGGGGGSGNQWWYNPASVPTVAAPAAATPTTTSTAPAAPAPRALTAFIPPQDVITPATTAVNVASGTPTTANATPTFGSGATNANANAIQSATNYTQYDEGGSVGDQGPSTLGPPPGLSGQGGQPVPPIYYNPGTYSQAGAPVGRGVSSNSLPAIYPAAAVPTYKRGGIVMGYDDGGDVDEGPQPEDAVYSQPTTDSSAPGQADMPSPVAQPVSFMGGAGRTPSFARMPTVQAPSPRIPRPSAGGGAPRGGRGGGGMLDFNPDETGTWYDKPENLPPEAPMIQDHAGNPSPGVTGALGAGLHFIGQLLQIGPFQQGLPDAQTQQERQAFASGQGAPSDRQVKQVMDKADPEHALGEMQRFMGALEMLYKYDILSGNPEQAQRDAASMLMYGREAAARYGKEAIKHYYKGDVQGALDSLQEANNYTVDGSNWHAQIKDNGTIHAERRNLNNSVLEWEANVAPQEILAAAVKVANGSAYWQMLEQAAYKYDPIAKAMVDQRAGLETEKQIQAAGPAYSPQPSPGGPLGPQAPQATPQSPQAPQGPQQTPASAQGPTTDSSPVPTPPAMGGANDLRRQLAAPTGIGNPPGTPVPPQASGGAQQVLNANTPPQVADAGAGPGAMPPTYAPSDLGGGQPANVPLEAPEASPIPSPDRTTAQGATPPATSDERAQPAAQINPLTRPDTVSNPNVAPMDEGGFAHVSQQIHQQLFTPGTSPYFLDHGGYRVNGEDYYPPQKQDLSNVTNPAALKILKDRQAEGDKLYQQARQAAFALAKDDEAKQVGDLRNTLNVTKDIYNRTQIAKGQAIGEANKEQATANAEMVKSAAARMKPAPEYFEDKTGMHMPVGALAKPAAIGAWGSEGGDNAEQLHPYLPSKESFDGVVDGISTVWRYNQFQTMGMEHAANLVKRIVADPSYGKILGKDGKPTGDDPEAVSTLPVPGDPGDKRVIVKINDPRGGAQYVAMPVATFRDLMLARNEYKQHYDEDEGKKAVRLEVEKSQAKAGGGLLNSIEGAAGNIITSVAPHPGSPVPPRPSQPPSRGLLQSPQGQAPFKFQLPPRVPNEQVPQEYKDQFPELNQ